MERRPKSHGAMNGTWASHADEEVGSRGDFVDRQGDRAYLQTTHPTLSVRHRTAVVAFAGPRHPRHSALHIIARSAGIALVVLAAIFPSLAQDDLAVRDFVARVNRAVYALAGKSGTAAETACRDLIRSLLDVDSIGQRAAAGAWDRMSGAQKARYLRATEARMAHECVRQNRNNSGAPIVVVGLRSASGGEWLLATRVDQTDAAARTVVWRLGQGGAPIRARDVLVDGRSTMLTLRQEVSDILDRTNGDLDGLIQTLAR
jgi:ABC-type transporter MlaC component